VEEIQYSFFHVKKKFGQLGLGHTGVYLIPMLIPTLSGIVKVAAGIGHSMFISNGKKLYTVGDNRVKRRNLTILVWTTWRWYVCFKNSSCINFFTEQCR
jgi:alpha-tubulin suppressor-like RCC1 family protein